MTLRGLICIAIRFYALTCLVTMLAYLPNIFWMATGARTSELNFTWSFTLSITIGYMLAAVLLWAFAHLVSAWIARSIEAPLRFEITAEQAYSFAFVFLGLYFVLNSVGATVVNLVRTMAILQHVSYDAATQTRMVQDFYKSGITFVSGLACLIGAPAWACKIARKSGSSTG